MKGKTEQVRSENGMKKIDIYDHCEETTKALELLKNYNNGVHKHIGATLRGISKCTNEFILQSNKEFAQYLIDNNEGRAYMGLYERPDHFCVEQAAKIFAAYPEGYSRVLSRYYQVIEDCAYRAMIDEFFEEYAPSLERLPCEYLPNRHLNNKPLILKLLAKNPGFVRYLDDCDLEQAVKVNPKCLEYKTSKIIGSITLMRKLCAANAECAVYACSPITTKAGVKRGDSNEEKKRKVNAWLTGTGERKALNNASGGGVARVATPKTSPPKPKFKI